MKVTLLVMTMNEIDGMKAIMPKIDPSWYDQLIVLDGGSTDGTVEWAREQGYFAYVQRQTGLRQGYLEVLPLVEGEIIITFSPDGNSLPEAIPALAHKMREGYDLVIASRYADGAKSADDDIVTRFGNWFFTGLVNVLFGGRYTDIMVMLRAFRKDMIYRLGLEKEELYTGPERLFFTRISWEPIMAARAARRGLRVGEIGFDEPKRIAGVRKLQIIRWGLAYIYQFAREFV